METAAKRVDLIPAQRRALILERVRANGAASIAELSEETGASPSTVRRDFEQLTEEGYLARTHGGALLVPPLKATFEREPALNAELRRAEKRAIGLEAAKTLNPGESVIFDSSSTVLEAVRAAAARDLPLTAVTNSLDIAEICAGVPQWRVIMPGGTVRPGTRLMVGQPGESFLGSIHADVCLVGTYAVTGRLLTDASLEIAALKRAMIGSARRTIVLADSSKFQAPAFCTFCDLSVIDEVFTDDGIAQEHLAALRAQGVRVTVAATPRERVRSGSTGLREFAMD